MIVPKKKELERVRALRDKCRDRLTHLMKQFKQEEKNYKEYTRVINKLAR